MTQVVTKSTHGRERPQRLVKNLGEFQLLSVVRLVIQVYDALQYDTALMRRHIWKYFVM